MNARKVKLLAGTFLLLLAVLLHLAGCRWGSANELADPPLITLRNNVVVDEDYASQLKIENDQFHKVDAAMDQLVGPDEYLHDKDDETQAKWHELDDELNSLTLKNQELTPLAYGKFGLYPRDSRDSGLILGVVTPAIFLTGGLFMLVWAFAAKSQQVKEDLKNQA
jgi:hypothetical protein